MEPPECVVCLQFFDEGKHTPRVLSCGHSLCQSCVADLRSHWGSNTSKGAPGHGLVRCPECKQHTKLPLGGFLELPKNIELMRLLKAPSAQNLNPEPEPKKEETLPCPISEVVYGESIIWILPQAAVKREDGDVMLCDKKLQPEVSFQSLSKIDGGNIEIQGACPLGLETLI